MPLRDYGVVIGRYQSFNTQQGKWMHFDLNIEVSGVKYQAAVDVNEPGGQFQYQVINDLDPGLFEKITSLADGWHPLASNPSSGAIDYARSPILADYRTSWINVGGNEAGDALIAMLKDSSRIFVFGTAYTSGKGVHDVHCNQGDPAGHFASDDGTWQDGAVFVIRGDGSLSAYLGKFAGQSLDTDKGGHPVQSSVEA